MTVHGVFPVLVARVPGAVRHLRRPTDRQDDLLAVHLVELDHVLPLLEDRMALGVDASGGPWEVGAVAPYGPHVVAVEVHLVNDGSDVDQPDHLPGADGRPGLAAVERAYVDLAGGAGGQGLLERRPGVRGVVGHREGAEPAAVVEHEVAGHGRCRGGVDDLAGPGPRRPHRVHVLAEPDPLPLELGLARAELPARSGRDDDEHAVQPQDPLHGPSPGIVVDVRAGGRRLEGQRRGGTRRDRARVGDSVDAECVRLRQPVVHPQPHGASDLRDDRPVGEEARPELAPDQVLTGQRGMRCQRVGPPLLGQRRAERVAAAAHQTSVGQEHLRGDAQARVGRAEVGGRGAEAAHVHQAVVDHRHEPLVHEQVEDPVRRRRRRHLPRGGVRIRDEPPGAGHDRGASGEGQHLPAAVLAHASPPSSTRPRRWVLAEIASANSSERPAPGGGTR